ncbi:hypothetical protein A2767_01870 [Candidatus Roizmanbacteria bacterium RIFCSPHIGHO2_01_FULL_35_10]|uniref:Uncharacterized protein n=1 Tax=Candidatus Roizmanbacteria bacterium RIFCSPLOWO2_01_FULL_35_13 TaxID=1802055 RepID=A0A1F7I7D2_9BACT|nr:MAG: hypothetical protein A2767_01870 [Candidatus Roizmanbacteria bacterium RIFCSPHIGHO2_01_FULL_35_10]OGK39280.1 MAG: hypothetical protein A3A74_00405 [Candidatus Roizmanbacteria bacterium RIFCSPLOWO2_01_FULL_35_13]
MGNRFEFISNSPEKIIFSVIASFFLNLFFIWVTVNVFQINNPILWLFTPILAVVLTYVLTRNYNFSQNKIPANHRFPYIIFFILLILVGFYFLEPVLRFPYSPIGIPNKDLHDGIASYINQYGSPPFKNRDSLESQFIPNSNNGLFLGYANAMHSFSAQLMKFGIFELHATWIAVVLGIMVASLALFLFARTMFKNPYHATIIAGLFGVSSYRIPYAIATSLPMFFSLTLVLPVLLIFLVSVHHYKNYFSAILPAVTLAALTASYSGTPFIAIGFIIVYLLYLWKSGYKKELSIAAKIILVAIPVLIFTLAFQDKFYWQNTFPTVIDFDPYEPSQLILPFDKPIYMLIYTFSLLVFTYQLVRKKHDHGPLSLKLTFLIINLALLGIIFFDLVFHYLNKVNSAEALINVERSGFFGGLNHQKFSRLALFQPFIFIFFFGQLVTLLKNRLYSSILLLSLLITVGVIKFDICRCNYLLYSSDSLYNFSEQAKPYTLLSDYRLILPAGLWPKEILDNLNKIKLVKESDEKVLLWDERDWSETAVAGWSSVYLKDRVLIPGDIGITNRLLDSRSLSYIVNNFKYILLIDPVGEKQQLFSQVTNWKNTAADNNVFLYQIE